VNYRCTIYFVFITKIHYIVLQMSVVCALQKRTIHMCRRRWAVKLVSSFWLFLPLCLPPFFLISSLTFLSLSYSLNLQNLYNYTLQCFVQTARMYRPPASQKTTPGVYSIDPSCLHRRHPLLQLLVTADAREYRRATPTKANPV